MRNYWFCGKMSYRNNLRRLEATRQGFIQFRLVFVMCFVKYIRPSLEYD